MYAHEPSNILLVDDQPAKLLTYELILKDLGHNLIKANSGAEALGHLLRTDVAVVLVDVCMPELDGFEFVRMLREHPRYEKTAVIFISAIHQTELDLVRGYASGAVDYVSVPVIPEILRAKVRVFLDLHRKTRELERLNAELEQHVSERTAELEKSNQRLRSSEERLRLASEAADFGTYEYNSMSDRLHCSAALKRLIGSSGPDQITLDEFTSLCHPDDRDAVRSCMLSSGRARQTKHEIEYRIPLPGGGVRWLLDRGASLTPSGAADEDASRVVGTVLDITDRKRTEESQALLMAELDHRVKNVLANVIAMARLSSKGVGTVDTFVQSLEGRIQAMARAHRLLRENSWNGADLVELTNIALQPFRSVQSSNIEIRGISLQLKPKLAQSLALVLHELATNAVKHGSLSCPDGRVTIDWSREGDRFYRMQWQETGGPPVARPRSRGFGLTVLNSCAAETGGRIQTNFENPGLYCEIVGPLDYEQDPVDEGAPVQPGPVRARSPADGGGRIRVLVVEDEPLIALDLKEELEQAGFAVVGPAFKLSEGLELAADAAVDVALLDVNLGKETSAPVAGRLRDRNIPFLFTTGYSDQALIPPDLQDVPRLSKPYQFSRLVEAICKIARNRAPCAPAHTAP
ncbi:MAG TPA: response regulator [Hyphomicrobiaceae bacterium]|nr:response regulator [Hyphomicrobiaceae bacterium]